MVPSSLIIALVLQSARAFVGQLPRKYLHGALRSSKNIEDSFENDQALEREWLRLERVMQEAALKERFDEAAEARDALFRLQMDEAGAVLMVNSAFYRAFSHRDSDAMAKLWQEPALGPGADGGLGGGGSSFGGESVVTCTHPGQKPLVGYRAVMDTWKGMFQSHPGQVALKVTPSENKCAVRGSHALVTCFEEVTSPVSGKSLGQTMQATNVFVKVQGQWRMVHHHASPAPSQSQDSLQDIVQKLKDTKQRIAETRKELKKSSFLLGNDEEDDEDEDEDEEDIASSLRSKLTSALKDKLGGENSVEFIEMDGDYDYEVMDEDTDEEDEDEDEEEDDDDLEAALSMDLTPDMLEKLAEALPEESADIFLAGEGQSISLGDVLERAQRLQGKPGAPKPGAGASRLASISGVDGVESGDVSEEQLDLMRKAIAPKEGLPLEEFEVSVRMDLPLGVAIDQDGRIDLVVPGGQLDRAGVLPGDLMVRVGDEPLGAVTRDGVEALDKLLANLKAEAKAAAKAEEDGGKGQYTVVNSVLTFARPPSKKKSKKTAQKFKGSGGEEAGGEEEDGWAELAFRFTDEDGSKVGFGWARDTATQRVVHVTPGGQAAELGVKAGWVVKQVGGRHVATNDEFEDAVKACRQVTKAFAVRRGLPLLLERKPPMSATG